MSSPTTKIDKSLFKTLNIRFEDHLKIEGNCRTIFSGTFGSGKSTFLTHFFAEKKETFTPLYIYPVNYSIASNEDIFRYIKYDLFLQLLSQQGVNLATYDFAESDKLYLYFRNNYKNLIKQSVKFANVIGKAIHPAMEVIANLAEFAITAGEKMKEKVDDQIKEKDEQRKVAEFLQAIQSETGSLYEISFITVIIEKAIAQIKATGKRVILIIEDLDRIDPEHIFRILNVFSANFDLPSPTASQFGIDTIVAACDETNIRNIFHNKYGSNVDYSGYLDKFYSNSIFQFAYSEQMRIYVSKMLRAAQTNAIDGRRIPDSVINTIACDHFIEYMVDLLQRHRLVNLRSFNRAFQHPLILKDGTFKFDNDSFRVFGALIIFELMVIADICGGILQAIEYMDRLKKTPETPIRNPEVIERLFAIDSFREHRFVNSGQFSYELNNRRYNGILRTTGENQYAFKQDGILATPESRQIATLNFFDFITVIEHILHLINSVPELRPNSYHYEP